MLVFRLLINFVVNCHYLLIVCVVWLFDFFHCFLNTLLICFSLLLNFNFILLRLTTCFDFFHLDICIFALVLRPFSFLFCFDFLVLKKWLFLPKLGLQIYIFLFMLNNQLLLLFHNFVLIDKCIITLRYILWFRQRNDRINMCIWHLMLHISLSDYFVIVSLMLAILLVHVVARLYYFAIGFPFAHIIAIGLNYF